MACPWRQAAAKTGDSFNRATLPSYSVRSSGIIGVALASRNASAAPNKRAA